MTTVATRARILGGLLVLSLVANGLLVVHLLRSSPPRAGTDPAAGRGEAGRADEPRRVDTRRVAQGAGQGTDGLARLLLAARAAASMRASADEGADAEPDLQTVLCRIAESSTRGAWLEKRAEILRSVRQGLADPGEQERDARDVAGRLARAAGAEDPGAAALESRYREVRAERLAAVQAAIDEPTVDYGAVLETTRGLFADEDRLVSEMFGSEALDRVRAAERESRLVVIAIVATLGGLPWEEAAEGL